MKEAARRDIHTTVGSMGSLLVSFQMKAREVIECVAVV